jgi:4-amino-4-deoxy-L-arabinose transferase-like glycosyltransferase
MSRPEVPRTPQWARLALLAILAFDVWLRCHTIGPTIRARLGVDLWPATAGESEPLDCDESVYAYAGRRILRGDVLYRDLTEPKPPGGYWLYTLADAIGGPNELTVRVTPIPIVLATIALVWWIGLRFRGPGAACLAAAIVAVVTTDPYLFGNGANLEHPITLCAVASLALMIDAWDRPGRARIVAAGAMLGAACLFKQVAIAHGPVYAAALLLRHHPLKGRVLDVIALAVGFALVVGAAALVLIARGAGGAAFEDVILYGAALARDTPPEPNAPPFLVRWVTGNADPRGRLPWPFGRETDYLVWWGTGSWPLWLVAVPAVAWLGLSRSSTPARRLVACWTASAWVQVAMPGLFWPHYYLLPVPGLALCVAVMLADALARARTGGRAAVIWGGWSVVVVLALGWTAYLQVRDYLMVPPEELTVRYKGGKQWVALRDLGRDLARRSRVWPDPRLFVWGWQSPLFLYSGLDGVSRHFFADPLMKAYATRGHPLTTPRIDRIMRDLNARPPELIFAGDPPFPALAAFLNERYLPHQAVAPDGRGLWVERGLYGKFEAAGPAPKRGSGR